MGLCWVWLCWLGLWCVVREFRVVVVCVVVVGRVGWLVFVVVCGELVGWVWLVVLGGCVVVFGIL